MISLEIDDKKLGHCGPLDYTPIGSQLVTKELYNGSNFTLFPCFVNFELPSLIADFDEYGNFNTFNLFFEVLNVKSLDNIINGNVAIVYFETNCATKSS